MSNQAKNTICLWYNSDAEEAARLYAKTFPDSSVKAVHRAPGVATVGSDTDSSVRRIDTAYEVRGMTSEITCYPTPLIVVGSTVNQVRLTYNDFGQLVKEEQEHAGAITAGTPSVQYSYASGASSSNQIRPTSLTYPNGRVITTDYGASGGVNDRLNRVSALKDGSTSLAAYTYLGASTVIQIDYAEPQVKLDLWGGFGFVQPDRGPAVAQLQQRIGRSRPLRLRL